MTLKAGSGQQLTLLNQKRFSGSSSSLKDERVRG
jgi:hypothetical protein